MQIRKLILLIFIAGLSAKGAEPGGINLADAITIALDNNPELRSSGAGVDAATGRARQAKLWSNPELIASKRYRTAIEQVAARRSR